MMKILLEFQLETVQGERNNLAKEIHEMKDSLDSLKREQRESSGRIEGQLQRTTEEKDRLAKEFSELQDVADQLRAEKQRFIQNINDEVRKQIASH